MGKFNWDDPLPPAKWEQLDDSERYWEGKLEQTRAVARGNGIVLGNDLFNRKPLSITLTQLSTHMHVLGASGVGKSYFLEALIKILILLNHGTCVIDPHGDLYQHLIDFCSYIHRHRPELRLAQRVIPFDVSHQKDILAFNPVARNARVLTYQVVTLMEVIRKCWGAGSFQETPRLARWLFNAAYGLIDAGATMVQMQDMLSPIPNEIQHAITQRIKNPRIRAEWEFLDSLKPERRGEYTESSFNRTREFGLHEILQLILGQRTKTIDFPSVLNEGKILLVNLAGQNTIAEDDKHLLGTLIVNELITAAFARPIGFRKPFFLLIDEFSHFVTKDICEILDGGRKFGLHLILAHQHLNQLKEKDPEVYYSTLTNARTKVVFGGMNDEDLDILSKELYVGELDPSEIQDEIWQTKFRPVESTRIVHSTSSSESKSESYSESEGYGSSESDGFVTHTSIANGEMYIPGSGLWAGPELRGTSTNFASSSGRNSATTSSYNSSTTQGHSTGSSDSESETYVPFYEFHEFKELSSRTFRSLEEQLYIKKAQLKRQPRQHASVLIPDSVVQMIKTGTLKDFSKLISYHQREEFIQNCFEQAGCFKSVTAATYEMQAIEEQLLAKPPVTIDTTTAGMLSEDEQNSDAAKPSKSKVKVVKKKKTEPNIFDAISDEITESE